MLTFSETQINALAFSDNLSGLLSSFQLFQIITFYSSGPPGNKFSFKIKAGPITNVSQFIKVNKKSAWPQFKPNIGQTTT